MVSKSSSPVVMLVGVAVTIFALLAALPASSASAVDDDDDDPSESTPAEPRWKVEGGAGTALRPKRRGNSQYIFSPFPMASVSYGERFEASTRDGLSYAVFNDEHFKIGPALEIDRKERQSTRRLGPLATTFGTGGAGAFAELKLRAENRVRVDATEGVFGREGLRVVLTGVRSFSIGEPLVLDLGVKGTGGDRRYVTSAYGLPEIRRSAAIAPLSTGPRRGSAGATAVGPTLGVTYAMTPKDSLTANLEASRVVGTASHTPAVRGPGSRNALSLEFNWRRVLFEAY